MLHDYNTDYNKSCSNICLHRRPIITKGKFLPCRELKCLGYTLLWHMLSVHKYWYFACNLALRQHRLSVGLFNGLSVG